MLTVFGSINVDLVLRAPKIAAPGETVLGRRVAESPGGKGANQAVAAARAAGGGLKVVMVGSIGDDAHGEIARGALVAAGVSPALRTDPKAATGAAIIVVDDSGENAITVIPGANGTLAPEHLPESALGSDALLCQGEVSLAATAAVIASYKHANPSGRAILNFAPAPDVASEDLAKILSDIDILIVNANEAAALEAILGLGLPGLARQSGLVVVVTQGAGGALVYRGADEALRAPSLAVTPVDTTGAGDTFCGVFAAMLCEGMDLERATRIACRAGALACCATGAQSAMPARDELFRPDHA